MNDEFPELKNELALTLLQNSVFSDDHDLNTFEDTKAEAAQQYKYFSKANQVKDASARTGK